MMIGSTEAGIAFSNASVCLIHDMSRPIGAHFHVPHGLSNAMLLPVFTVFSLRSALSRYAVYAREMGLGNDELGDQGRASLLVEELESLNRDLTVPSPAQFGIAKQQWDSLLPIMVEQALASGSTSNPIVPTPEEVEMLYRRAWT